MMYDTLENGIKVKILKEYLRKKGLENVGNSINEDMFMFSESIYTHKGRNFYVSEDEKGNLIFSEDSLIDKRIRGILNKNLSKDEIDEYFREIQAIKMKETISTFVRKSSYVGYRKLLLHEPKDEHEEYFYKQLRVAIGKNISQFTVPIYEPSIDSNGMIVFDKNNNSKPISCSYEKIAKIALKSGCRIGSMDEDILYVATVLIRLIDEGWDEDKAWKNICHSGNSYLDKIFGISKKFFIDSDDKNVLRITIDRSDIPYTFVNTERKNGGHYKDAIPWIIFDF